MARIVKVRWSDRPVQLLARGDVQSEIRWRDTGSWQALPNDQLVFGDEIPDPPAPKARKPKREVLNAPPSEPLPEPEFESEAAPKPKVNRGAGDELSAKLKVISDLAALRALAERNEVWDSKYEALPNFGLARMQVGNRLRARVKRGVEVQW